MRSCSARACISLGVAAILVLATACVRTEPTRYYLLEPISGAGDEGAKPARPHAQNAALRIGLGPVTVPPHLDRPEIVTRISANRVDLTEFDSWAEPLKDNLIRVLAENLSRLVPSAAVVTSSFGAATTVDFQVTVDVQRLDAGPDPRARLVAFWQLFEEEGRRLVAARRFERSTPASLADVASIVAAESELVAALAREIATRLREIDR